MRNQRDRLYMSMHAEADEESVRRLINCMTVQRPHRVGAGVLLHALRLYVQSGLLSSWRRRTDFEVHDHAPTVAIAAAIPIVPQTHHSNSTQFL